MAIDSQDIRSTFIRAGYKSKIIRVFKLIKSCFLSKEIILENYFLKYYCSFCNSSDNWHMKDQFCYNCKDFLDLILKHPNYKDFNFYLLLNSFDKNKYYYSLTKKEYFILKVLSAYYYIQPGEKREVPFIHLKEVRSKTKDFISSLMLDFYLEYLDDIGLVYIRSHKYYDFKEDYIEITNYGLMLNTFKTLQLNLDWKT